MTRSSLRWIFLAILSTCLVLYLLGNDSVQLWDRDEPRYAQTSRQMLQSGDWVVPRFLDTVRTAKPVLIYWAQASVMAVVGDNAFAARFPSAIAMVLTLAILGLTIWREAGSNRALWTIFIFGTCVLAIGSAKMCLTDSVLLLFVVISQLCIYRLWRYGICPMTVIVLGISIGLAGLTKGPVAIGVNVATMLALALFGRRSRVEGQAAYESTQFPVLIGVVLAMIFLVVFPWLYMIQERAPGFLTHSISHDVIERARSGQEGHSHPPGFYSLIVWGTFFPWSLLIPAALVHGWKRRHLPVTRFALAALVGPWVMFELVAGKLPHYVLPTYPALAYLVADMLVRASRGAVKDLRDRNFRIAAWCWAMVLIVIGGGAWAALVVAKQFDFISMLAASAMAIVAAVVGIGTAHSFSAGRVLKAARTMGLGTALFIAIAYEIFLPRYQPLRLSVRVADAMRNAGAAPGTFGYMIDYKEPSLAFHQGGGLHEQRNNSYLNESDPAQWPGWIVMTRRIWEQTHDDAKARWEIVASEKGLAYNEGGRSEVLVLRRR